MVMGYFYSTQKGMGDSVGYCSYRTISREKVISATGFMAQTGYPQQCVLRARRTGWLHILGGICHLGPQWEVHMLDKVLYAR